MHKMATMMVASFTFFLSLFPFGSSKPNWEPAEHFTLAFAQASARWDDFQQCKLFKEKGLACLVQVLGLIICSWRRYFCFLIIPGFLFLVYWLYTHHPMHGDFDE
ncbi:hypothetical protein MN608_01586 [Microdochium nivale]|nr:hypothetical protein MN608_01586 [Microdochium nivale]